MGVDRELLDPKPHIRRQQNTFPAKYTIIHHFQLQHLLTTRGIKEPEDAALSLNLLGRLGHNSVGKEHYCIS